LMAEFKRLEALKKDTSLSALKKVAQLREIGQSFDEKISPLLNADQQPKFQAMREAMRKRLIEKMASEAASKVAGAVKQDIEDLRQKAEGSWLGKIGR